MLKKSNKILMKAEIDCQMLHLLKEGCFLDQEILVIVDIKLEISCIVI